MILKLFYLLLYAEEADRVKFYFLKFKYSIVETSANYFFIFKFSINHDHSCNFGSWNCWHKNVWVEQKTN